MRQMFYKVRGMVERNNKDHHQLSGPNESSLNNEWAPEWEAFIEETVSAAKQTIFRSLRLGPTSESHFYNLHFAGQMALREHRKKHGLTIAEVAAKSLISPVEVAMLEAGLIDPADRDRSYLERLTTQGYGDPHLAGDYLLFADMEAGRYADELKEQRRARRQRPRAAPSDPPGQPDHK